ncbi:MAG: AAA family ATPase [Bacteroidia bacterium]|nr:AAA family ATPase [Bacteroidia bacterium]
MDKLVGLYRGLIDQTETIYLRYLHNKVDWNNRLTAIMGARGAGKTTLLLQHIKLNLDLNDTLYVNADDFYFAENKLFDLASTFYKNGGKHLYIDEIHKYSQWSKEVKMMYDYFPDLTIVFTGSSILDIYKGSDDLSRRALTYKMPGMSFREYLEMSKGIRLPSYSLEEILQNKVEIPGIDHPLPLFREYLQIGYYPFYKEPGYQERLRNIINLTLETDIPIYANMNVATAKKIKQLLYIVSQSSPFKPNLTKIAQLIDVHRNQVADYLFYLEKAGIIALLRSNTKGVRLLGKVEKVYLDNPNIIASIAEGIPNTGTIRETFFLNQMGVNHDVFLSEVADFTIENYTFEIGGKNKTKKQIAGLDNAFIVKDDIEHGYMNTVPLWAFGFNY